MNGLLEYNKLLEKGVNYLNMLSNDQYIDDIAQKNSFNSVDDFLNELNSILYESYVSAFTSPANDWEAERVRFTNTLNELGAISKYDRKQMEKDDKSESKKLLDGLDEYVNEISMFYDNANRPIYNMDDIQKLMNGERINLMNAKGRKNRQIIYNRILEGIESTRMS